MAASLPPLSVDRFFLTVLSCSIVAPLLAKSLMTCSFSSRVTGGMGEGSRADPPPTQRHIIQNLIIQNTPDDR